MRMIVGALLTLFVTSIAFTAEQPVKVIISQPTDASDLKVADLTSRECTIDEAATFLRHHDLVMFLTRDIPNDSCDSLRECGAGCDSTCKAVGSEGKSSVLEKKGERCDCGCADGKKIGIQCFKYN